VIADGQLMGAVEVRNFWGKMGETPEEDEQNTLATSWNV